MTGFSNVYKLGLIYKGIILKDSWDMVSVSDNYDLVHKRFIIKVLTNMVELTGDPFFTRRDVKIISKVLNLPKLHEL